jgi:antitoxin ParD1/3/4
MHIHLPNDVEELVRRKVEAGEYETPSDLVIDAIHLLDAQDRLRQQQIEDLRREIALGLEECERGETEPFTRATVRQIAAEGRKLLIEKSESLRSEADRLAESAKQPFDETAPAD